MVERSRKAIFLDRDGVLNYAVVRNGKPFAPTCPEEFVIFDEAGAALAALKNAGYLLVVVSNQPDVGNGKVDRETVEEMNIRLQSKLPIDAIKVCYHSQNEGCGCRKPLPGMITSAAEELRADLTLSYMIGDRWSDLSAGKAAGCRTIFIDRGYVEKLVDEPDAIAGSIGSAAEMIIAGDV